MKLKVIIEKGENGYLIKDVKHTPLKTKGTGHRNIFP